MPVLISADMGNTSVTKNQATNRFSVEWALSCSATATVGYQCQTQYDFAQFAQFNHPGFDFYSLQKGNPEEKNLNTERLQHWSSDNLHIFTEYIDDFADTAAFIHHLDLLICVDTSVAHLAAAMGKPVWLLNRFDTCWRWLLGREDIPWYPTLRIFRQPKLGDWNSVINAVLVALQGFLKSSF